MKRVDPAELVIGVLTVATCVLLGLAGAFLSTKSPDEYRPGLAAVCAVLAVVVFLFAIRCLPEGKRESRALRLALYPVFWFCSCGIMFPVMQGARSAAPGTQCLSNIKQLAIAMQIYVTDADDRMPPTPIWRTALAPYAKDGLINPSRCPFSETKWSYGQNRSLGSLDTAKIAEPRRTVMLFEAESEVPNITGGQREVVRRHGGKSYYGFAEGHAKAIDSEAESELVWKP